MDVVGWEGSWVLLVPKCPHHHPHLPLYPFVEGHHRCYGQLGSSHFQVGRTHSGRGIPLG
jgi:hypothetical protein